MNRADILKLLLIYELQKEAGLIPGSTKGFIKRIGKVKKMVKKTNPITKIKRKFSGPKKGLI